jgi:signal transduction histidine kinase
MATNRLNALVSNILKLSKLENQEIVPASDSFDLCSQLSECVLTFESALEEKHLQFTATMDDCANINSDQSMLEIVWQNLLANAIKYTEDGGSITLVQTSDAHSVTVTLTDTGCGMDSATQERIFNKFYQGDSSHSSEGNGLGLALVARVIELIDGTISVSSELGHGTTFVVNLKANY